MLRLSNITVDLRKKEDLKKEICYALNLKEEELLDFQIHRKSLDARKNKILFVYSFDVKVKNEEKTYRQMAGKKRIQLKKISENQGADEIEFPVGSIAEDQRPVVVGSGPAGLFATLILALGGKNPILLERGKRVDERAVDVDKFWITGKLDEESNVQFGEGGAGTFSDGKLTTQINDTRCGFVLKELLNAGAPREILYLNKPHIGTDILKIVVRNLREKIVSLGGEVRFQHKLTNLIIEDHEVRGLIVNDDYEIRSDQIILALGHSARDTLEMLHERGVFMEQKPFSLGVRIEHLQKEIDKVQYGKYAGNPKLGASDYKLSHRCRNGRGVYTFCMCPGGEVIGASSEANRLVTNGMSRYKRNEVNANAALLVGIDPRDFPGEHPLAGFQLQRELEQKAFELGGKNYYAPVQRVEDFLLNQETSEIGKVQPSYLPGVKGTNLRRILPEYVSKAIEEALPHMDHKLKGFADADSILTGVETRSSSPVRIKRNENFRSSIKGLYPAGEGAGYAGGIISAAVDGVRVAQELLKSR